MMNGLVIKRGDKYLARKFGGIVKLMKNGRAEG